MGLQKKGKNSDNQNDTELVKYHYIMINIAHWPATSEKLKISPLLGDILFRETKMISKWTKMTVH